MPAQQVCDAGTNSSQPPYTSIDGSLITQLSCDQNISTLLSDTVENGTADTCFNSVVKYNDSLVFPKIEACCPLVKIPIKAQEGDTDFWVYESEGVKVY